MTHNVSHLNTKTLKNDALLFLLIKEKKCHPLGKVLHVEKTTAWLNIKMEKKDLIKLKVRFL